MSTTVADSGPILTRIVITLGLIVVVSFGLKTHNEATDDQKQNERIRLVASTYGQILQISHEEWQKVGGGVGVSVNFLGKAVNDVVLNERGWPIGASNGTFFPRITLGSSVDQKDLDNICAQIFNNIMVNTDVRAISGDVPCGSEFCAQSGPDRCQYNYAKSAKEGYTYRPSTGTTESFFQDL